MTGPRIRPPRIVCAARSQLPEQAPELLTGEEVMQRLHISHTTLRRWGDTGRLTFIQPFRRRLYHAEQVQRLANPRARAGAR